MNAPQVNIAGEELQDGPVYHGYDGRLYNVRPGGARSPNDTARDLGPWTPEMEAEAERIGSRPQFIVTVEYPGQKKWQCVVASLNWAVIERAYQHWLARGA